MKISLVKQEEKFGCVLACLAMVLGKSYQEVRADFYHDFEKKGFKVETAIGYLADKGFQFIHKEVGFYNRIDFSKSEMLRPFADCHLVRIKQFFDDPNTHLVVMDKNGKIFCPDGATEENIKSSYHIGDVWGIYK